MISSPKVNHAKTAGTCTFDDNYAEEYSNPEIFFYSNP